jgi:hypothetical protein
MTFYPFNAAYPKLDLHFKAANLPPEVNHWKKLFDFSKDDASMPQPHWQVIGKLLSARSEIVAISPVRLKLDFECR